ncbi:MAG: phytanoyl-CoA dioxygenase family protein [Pseudanabaenales cyanobacterium]|nr:phytanoyl-CoA dioxygenase family protein [Pseudanabaenales cyanobacterium]
MLDDLQSRIFYDQDLQRDFDRDGYVVIEFLGSQELISLQSIFAKHQHHHEQAGFSATILNSDLDYRQTVHQEISVIIGGIVEAIISDYRLVCCGFAVKQPSQVGGEMPLHQDITMVESEPRPGISIWAPLVDVDQFNGCLQLVAGSHHLNFNCPLRAPGAPFVCTHLETEIRDHYLQSIPLQAGQAIIMNHATFHASEGNRSRSVRPVVANVLAPNGQSLNYYYRHKNDVDTRLEAFEVDEHFFLRHSLGARPHDSESLGFFPETIDWISAASLAEYLSVRH